MRGFRLVGGTDVAPSHSGDANRASPPRKLKAGVGPDREELSALLEPVHELFKRYKQAQREYELAIKEVATRTGRKLSSVAQFACSIRRERANRFEPDDWCSLM
jgi:hypothetical protein